MGKGVSKVSKGMDFFSAAAEFVAGLATNLQRPSRIRAIVNRCRLFGVACSEKCKIKKLAHVCSVFPMGSFYLCCRLYVLTDIRVIN